MTYIQSIGIPNIDSLMTIFYNTLSNAPGWGSNVVMNSSSAPVSTGPTDYHIGREFVFHCTGSATDPTRFYVSIYRTFSSFYNNKINFMAATGIKEFDSPLEISSVSKVSTTLSVTCSAPHNLSVYDIIMLNGINPPELNVTWDTTSTRTVRVLTVPSPTIFTTSIDSGGVLTGTGGKVLSLINPIGNRIGGGFGAHGLDLVDGPLNLYMYYDTHRFCGIVEQSTRFMPFYIGETTRDNIPLSYRHRSYLSSDLNAGSNVTASLTLSSSNFQANQFICFVHPSSSTAGTMGTGSFERVRILSKLDSSSFTCTVTNSYPAGTLVGEDPCPVFIIADEGTYSNSTFSSYNGYTIFGLDMHRGGREAGTTEFGLQSWSPTTHKGITATATDPDQGSYYQGAYIWLSRTSTPSTGSRGRLVGFASFPVGSVTAGDIMRTQINPNVDYILFPAVTCNTIDGSYTGYSVAIGPSSSV